VGRSQTYRQIDSFPDRVQNINLNDVVRRVMERIYAEQGRKGPGERFDSLNIKADERRSPLRFRGKGATGAGAIAFSGTENSSMFIAKGAYMNDNGSWVAEDVTAVIQEMNRDSTTPIMYRNTGLTIGQIFQPTQVGAVVTGSTPGGGGAVIIPIPGGPEESASVSVQAAEVELDFGEQDKDYEVFEFPSVFELSTSARILMTPSGRAATGRDEDENEFDTFSCAARPFQDGGWHIRAYVHSLRGVVVGPYRFTYTVAV
jgi:hypothetical protein